MKSILLVFIALRAMLSLASAEVEQLPELAKLSSLVHPAKLSSLKAGNRAANPRFRKLMYWTHQAEQQGISAKVFLQSLYKQFGEVKSYANARHVFAPSVEINNLAAQYRLGRAYGIYTTQNLAKLRKGRSPLVTRGSHQGQKLHVDHILSKKDYPELENCMANLSWLPAKQNLAKGAKFTNAAKRRAKELQSAVGWRVGSD